MDWIKKAFSWIWGGWGNILWITGLFATFALPAWAVRMTGIMSQFAPFSWVAAGFMGMGLGVAALATVAWARGRLVRARYDAKLLAQGGAIDVLAKTFERKRIFLNEFALPSKPIIEGKTFIDCEIIGPASVILNIGNSVDNHQLPFCDAYVMGSQANPNNGYLFNNCVFRGCSFIRVSLMFSLSEYEKAKTVDWLNWVSIRPDHLDEAVPKLLQSTPSPALLEGPKKKKWPWQR